MKIQKAEIRKLRQSVESLIDQLVDLAYAVDELSKKVDPDAEPIMAPEDFHRN